ncbi:MAG: DsbA family protein [Pseudomonadota bacterium]
MSESTAPSSRDRSRIFLAGCAAAAVLVVVGAVVNGATAPDGKVAGAAVAQSSGEANTGSSARGSTSGAASATAAGTVPEQGPYDRATIGKIVRDYILANPEILLEAQQALEVKMRAEQEANAKVAIQANAAKIFRASGDPIFGNPDGDVTVVEFFDYNCGFCRRAIPHLTDLVASDKNVKVVFKEFPIFGEESEQAALAALAAREQGKYWEMHVALLERPGRANRQKALDIAASLKLDVDKLKVDMAKPELRKVITDVQALATDLGIQGTPHFLVGPQPIPGAPEDLLQQIQSRVADVRKEGCTVC